MSKPLDWSGTRINMLTVQHQAGRTKGGYVLWECLCDCGKKKIVASNDLSRDAVFSCGCTVRPYRLRTHGMTGTRTFKSWEAMKGRCLNPNDPSFERYGGKGITVCKQWQDDFSQFLSDMGERPVGMTLDRIDSRGNYEPANCRWATPRQQVLNRKMTVYMTVNGETKSRDEWCRITGLTRTTISSRLSLGWTPEQAVLTPARTKRPNGEGRPRQN